MNKISITMILMLLFAIGIQAQNNVKGTVVNSENEQPIQGVLVSLKNGLVKQLTGVNGEFSLKNLPKGNHIVTIGKQGFETQNFPVTMNGSEVDLGTIYLYSEQSILTRDESVITITDDELNDETSAADNIAGLLQSSRDVYLRSAAYEFSPSFYRIRGLDSENGKVLINGVLMNKLSNGRPQWSNWGGLNDVLRNQEFTFGFAPSNNTFGGVLGSTQMNVRASDYREGGKISYASSNRSYRHRLMASYASGLSKDGWAFTVAASRRMADEGFQEGTSYNAYSMFGSIEKKINDKHSLNFTSIYAFNRRGKSAPHTQEVYDLKGTKYNEYWGYQDGKKRNSRLKEVEEPILMLNHYWNISENTTLNTNVAYQFGKIGNSRLDYSGGNNPSPAYYQKLPSYWLDRNDIQQTYDARERFENDGQVNWDELYQANLNNATLGKTGAYVLYEDRNDDKQFTANTILNTQITDNITVNAKAHYTSLKSENFASILDMLGGNGYTDINRFGNIGTPERQNNLLNPNRVVNKGDRFKYNYNLNSNVIGGFVQGQFKYKKVDFYVAGDFSTTSHQREGLYKNGRFESSSLGKSEKLNFTNYGFKGGATYKITGRHMIDINAGYLTKAPTLRNTFSNARENNNVVKGLDSEKIMAADLSYVIRSPFVTSKLTGYYTKVQDATDINYFFLQGSFGEAFIQEVVTNIDKKHIGAELGIEVKVLPTLKVKAAGNYGQYTYDNNPNVYIAAEDTEQSQRQGFVNGIRDLGTASLKNYKVAAGPQKAFSLGFEYRDPSYWWLSATANYFDDTYIDVSPISRTSAFYKDADGLPFNNYDPQVAKQLLKQEKFDDYYTLNAFGGKSWRIGKDFNLIGFTLGISNILNQKYKTGGFEQGRRSNYQNLQEEMNRSKRLFGPKYWYGRGTTYFFNVYYRF